ncbi:MAG: response regulator [Candidatus Hydrogenedentota bacterium]|nr:MAG: response regulator [Candidatus Hydrogenedentota bacterium]
MKSTILIVEDDPIQRRQMTRLLTELGHMILQASTGREAVKIVEEEHVDLVLTDLKMPNMDGIALIKHLKERHAQIPIGVLTSYPEELSNLQVEAILYKPFRGDQLKELVQRLI